MNSESGHAAVFPAESRGSPTGLLFPRAWDTPPRALRAGRQGDPRGEWLLDRELLPLGAPNAPGPIKVQVAGGFRSPSGAPARVRGRPVGRWRANLRRRALVNVGNAVVTSSTSKIHRRNGPRVAVGNRCAPSGLPVRPAVPPSRLLSDAIRTRPVPDPQSARPAASSFPRRRVRPPTLARRLPALPEERTRS